MSATYSADPIERPEDLALPPEAEEVFDHLTEEGARNFSREIMHALYQAQAKGNLRPVRDVVEAWYRSLLLKQHPDYRATVRWAREEDPFPALAAEKVVEQYAASE
jgi:hypothetical protein